MPTTSIPTARKPHQCGNYPPCRGTITPGDLYIKHKAFPSEPGNEDGTRPVELKQCLRCADSGGPWVRQHYGVPAQVGMRVAVDGEPGNIVGFGDGLRVLFDTGQVAPAHPTWRVTYFTTKGPVQFGMDEPVGRRP